MTEVISSARPAGPPGPGGEGAAMGGLAGAAPPLQIVPLAGIPLVGAALVGLVVALAVNDLWPLEFFHVVGGGLWTGIDLFLGFIIGPCWAG